MSRPRLEWVRSTLKLLGIFFGFPASSTVGGVLSVMEAAEGRSRKMASTPWNLTALAAEHHRLAGLASHLLADHHGGEDLAQESAYRWVLAQREGRWRGDASAGSPERLAWLKQTVRRLAANQRRGAAHRRDREVAAAAPERLPSTAEIAARAEVCRQLQDAIEALPPAQAEVLRDHYLGGLSVAELAQRDGLSAPGVKSRIQRARAALRELLERRGLAGDSEVDEHWSVLLLPVAAVARRSALQLSAATATPVASIAALPLASLSTLVLMKKSLAAAAALLCAGALWFVAVQPGLRPAPASGGVVDLDRVSLADVSLRSGDDLLVAPEGESSARSLAANALEPTSAPVPAPANTIEVRSTAGIPLTTAYFQEVEFGDRSSLERAADSTSLLDRDGLVSAPGHLPRLVPSGEELVELEPFGVLTVRAAGLRAGCVEVHTSALMSAAMQAETSFGFIGDDEFRVAVNTELWPNYNLRATPRLTLRSGREVSIDFLPLLGASETVPLLLEEGDLDAERADLLLQVTGDAAPFDDERVLLSAMMLREAEVGVFRKSGPWGLVMVTDPFRPTTKSPVGPGPYTVDSLVLGRRYALTLLAESGAHVQAEVLFDGSPATLEWTPPASILASVLDEMGAPLHEVHVVVSFPAVGAEAQNSHRWTDALGAGTTSHPLGGRMTVALPYEYEPYSLPLGPMPSSAAVLVECAGHESVRASVQLEPGGQADLGKLVLRRRRDGIDVVGDGDGHFVASRQLAWLDPASSTWRQGEITGSVQGESGSRTVFLEDRDAFAGGWPEELILRSTAIVRAVREGGQRYRAEPTVERRLFFQLDPSLRAVATDVDLAITVGDSRHPVYTFYRVALGTTRSLTLGGPREGARLEWCPRTSSGVGSGDPADWRDLGPLVDLPDRVELKAAR